MRLIIEYEVTDGFTYHCTNTVPVVYESAEAFLVDFELSVGGSKVNRDRPVSITLGSQEFDVNNFVDDGMYYPPNVYTLDEWFESVEKRKQ